MKIDRSELVRRLLGVATDLFIRNGDRLSVHCLASSAAEHGSELARTNSGKTFNDHILKTFPDRKIEDIRALRNRDWNAIKHARKLDGSLREPQIELNQFSDRINDHVLFITWYDFSRSGAPLPIAAQVFQVWYLEIYPEKVDPKPAHLGTRVFGNISTFTRSDQKRELAGLIAQTLKDEALLGHSMTDPRPLVLPPI